MEIGAVVNAVGTVVGVEEEDSVPFDGVVLGEPDSSLFDDSLPDCDEPLPDWDDSLPDCDEPLPDCDDSLPDCDEPLPDCEDSPPGIIGPLPG